MVLLRGLFGARVSYLPTALNVLQLFGWSIFELVTIATAAHTVAPAAAQVGVRADRGGGDRAADHPAARRHPGAAPLRHRAPCSSSCATCSSSCSGTRCPRSPTGPGPATGRRPTRSSPSPSRSRRWPPTTCGTRAARGRRSRARWPATASPRCSATSSGCSRWSPSRTGTPTTSSARSSRCRSARSASRSWPRGNSTSRSPTCTPPRSRYRTCGRCGTGASWPGVITALTTAGALWLNIADYENFLTLLGSVFVPMSAVLIVDYFAVTRRPRRRWDLSAAARSRWSMLLPWAVGFVIYQLINPGYVSWWASAWTSFGRRHRVYPGQLDVGLDPVLLRRRDSDTAGQRNGKAPAAVSTSAERERLGTSRSPPGGRRHVPGPALQWPRPGALTWRALPSPTGPRSCSSTTARRTCSRSRRSCRRSNQELVCVRSGEAAVEAVVAGRVRGHPA